MKKTMKVEVELPVFEGYEYVRFGVPEGSDYILSHNRDRLILVKMNYKDFNYFIYKKLEVWRDAKVPTVGKFEDWGKKARFRDDDSDPWTMDYLTGYSTNDELFPWLTSFAGEYSTCQVLEGGE